MVEAWMGPRRSLLRKVRYRFTPLPKAPVFRRAPSMRSLPHSAVTPRWSWCSERSSAPYATSCCRFGERLHGTTRAWRPKGRVTNGEHERGQLRFVELTVRAQPAARVHAERFHPCYRLVH